MSANVRSLMMSLPVVALMAQEPAPALQQTRQETLTVDVAPHKKSWVDKSRTQLYRIVGGGRVPDGPYVPLTNSERWRLYYRDTYLSSAAAIRPGFSAALSQLKNSPKEWDGFPGYTYRFGQKFAARAVRNSIEDGGNAVLGFEPRYIPCKCKGGMGRIGHAILYSYITFDEHGHKRPNLFRYMGSYGGELATYGLIPGQYDVWKAMRRGNMAIYSTPALNILREFSPEIYKLLRIK
jgi:hypothetical protein